jgi:cytidylate kinase
LIPGERYYGRIDMPLFPRRDMGVWFRAETDRLARIERVHERDEKEWSGYVAARERILIREMKGKQGD